MNLTMSIKLTSFDLAVYKLIAHEHKRLDFEQWVYSNENLETILSSDEYLELISLNYKTPSSLYDAEKILKKYINFGNYCEWFVRNTLQKIIEKPSNVHTYIEECYDLYCGGYNFMDNLALGYGLDINTHQVSYDPEQSDLIKHFYPEIENEARKVIEWLDNKKIIITGHNGAYQGIEYTDLRSDNEKIPTGYKISKN